MSKYNKYEKSFRSSSKIIQMRDWKAEEIKSNIDKLELRKNALYNDLSQDRKKESSIKSREKDEVICLHKEIEELKNENELLTKIIAYLARKIS